METKRSYYAILSYGKDTQSHETHMEKKKILEDGLRAACKSFPDCGDKLLSVTALYSEKANLAACYYRGHAFLGFADAKTNEISFEDDTSNLVRCPKKNLENLVIRFENAIREYSEKGTETLMSCENHSAWKAKQPVMDQIVEYEHSLSRMPEARQRIIRGSNLYDQQIEDIIQQENPIVEQAWEEYFDMDLGETGKRNIEAPTSTLEEDILEKAYHKDFGGKGYIDQEWHQGAHAGTFESKPLSERFRVAEAIAGMSGGHVAKESILEKETESELVRFKP